MLDIHWYWEHDLGLVGNWEMESKIYILCLYCAGIRLGSRDDSQVQTWQHSEGDLIVKLAYDILDKNTCEGSKKWWNALIWKWKAPFEADLFHLAMSREQNTYLVKSTEEGMAWSWDLFILLQGTQNY